MNWQAPSAKDRAIEERASDSAGLYIHFPWCVRICSYCDFDRQVHRFDLVPTYVEALKREIATLPAAIVHSVFFGGGTPSLLSASQAAAVMEAATCRMRMLVEVEVTLEANPDDTSKMDFAGLLSAGVNRISMGVQCLDDRWLRLLGRRHSAAEAREAVSRVRRGGVRNLNLDLMYGLPGQTVADWKRTLLGALALEPEHLSCYLLTIDESVPLGRDVTRGRLSLPIDDEIGEQYELTRQMLAEDGFEQYEISNWARPGRACRHNLTYWRDEPYLGVGAGAASSWQGRRYKNSPVVQRYLAAVADGRSDLQEDEHPEWLTAVQDYLALALRLRQGLDLDRFAGRFGVSLHSLAGDEIERLRAADVLEEREGHLLLSERYLLVTNEVLARLRAAVERSSLARSTASGQGSAD